MASYKQEVTLNEKDSLQDMLNLEKKIEKNAKNQNVIKNTELPAPKISDLNLQKSKEQIQSNNLPNTLISCPKCHKIPLISLVEKENIFIAIIKAFVIGMLWPFSAVAENKRRFENEQKRII